MDTGKNAPTGTEGRMGSHIIYIAVHKMQRTVTMATIPTRKIFKIA